MPKQDQNGWLWFGDHFLNLVNEMHLLSSSIELSDPDTFSFKGCSSSATILDDSSLEMECGIIIAYL